MFLAGLQDGTGAPERRRQEAAKVTHRGSCSSATMAARDHAPQMRQGLAGSLPIWAVRPRPPPNIRPTSNMRDGACTHWSSMQLLNADMRSCTPANCREPFQCYAIRTTAVHRCRLACEVRRGASLAACPMRVTSMACKACCGRPFGLRVAAAQEGSKTGHLEALLLKGIHGAARDVCKPNPQNCCEPCNA